MEILRGTLISALVALMASQSLLLNASVLGQEDIIHIPRQNIPSAVDAEIADAANDIPGTAIMLLYSDTEWTGSYVGSDLISAPMTGAGDRKAQIICEGDLGRYNVAFQKQTDEGYLTIAVIQNRELLNMTSTDDPLGIVNMGGFCATVGEEPGPGVRDSACLIATAAFGSELAPQVQFLRNFRDNQILSTTAGQNFMTAFNTVYYSFSPQVADYEREQPWLQQTVRIAIYPLLGILTVSEKAYSASEGEYGAVAAGLVASAMIGAVYLAPVGFSIKRVREGAPSYRLLATIAVVVSTAMFVSLLVGDSTALMMSTSAFVLSIAAISAIVVTKVVTQLLRRNTTA